MFLMAIRNAGAWLAALVLLIMGGVALADSPVPGDAPALPALEFQSRPAPASTPEGAGRLVPPMELFQVRGIRFYSPVADFSVHDIIQHSIGADQQFPVEDGLPHFGAKRDDWLGKPVRAHRGFDIYCKDVAILAAADGQVIRVANGTTAGPYVKIDHGQNIYTLYIHLSEAQVREGQTVRAGQRVGYIRDATGNAFQPQLHFELKFGDQSQDPLPLIEQHHREDAGLIARIQAFRARLPFLVEQRDELVRQRLAE